MIYMTKDAETLVLGYEQVKLNTTSSDWVIHRIVLWITQIACAVATHGDLRDHLSHVVGDSD